MLPVNEFLLDIIVQHQLQLQRYKMLRKQPSVYSYRYIYYYQKESSTAELRARIYYYQLLSVSLWANIPYLLFLLIVCIYVKDIQNVLPHCCDLFYGACKPIPEIHWSKLALVGNNRKVLLAALGNEYH